MSYIQFPVAKYYTINNTVQKECSNWLKELNLMNDDCCNNVLSPTYIYVDKPYYVKGSYKDLDHDKDVIKQVVKYYYHKIFEYWLLTCCADVLGYLKIDGDDVKFVDSEKDFSKYVDTSIDAHKKINFLMDYISKKLVYKWLKKYVSKRDVSWYKLQNEETSVKKFLHDCITDRIVEKIR